MIKRIFTALFSLDKSAYFGAVILLIAPISNFLDKILCNIVKSSHMEEQDNVPLVLFIVGPPRSGTTIVYQALVQYLPSTYFSNLHAITPSFATRILKNSFGKFKYTKNYYGYSYGWNGVNEGNNVLHAIYGNGQDRHAIRERFVKFVNTLRSNNNIIIVKNVYSYNKLQVLLEVNPEINVIQVHRELLQVSQSVFKAYRERGYFAPIPETLKNITKKIEPHEFAVQLVNEIELELEKQKLCVGEHRWFDLTYEKFCENPIKEIHAFVKHFNLVDLKLNKNVDVQLKASVNKKVGDEDFEKIKFECNRLQ